MDNSRNIRTQSEKENSSQLVVIPMEKEKYVANRIKPHHKIENIFFIDCLKLNWLLTKLYYIYSTSRMSFHITMRRYKPDHDDGKCSDEILHLHDSLSGQAMNSSLSHLHERLCSC